ncbi:hypothetical protein MRS44_006070 [Fusarium solani]|uniref:uncharacterized protein n=1 Tax=Fusarium solani TaxID=169388 RepID=UPI0032C42A81|nr:hypothetical protein MRS44_006070 [Fusarium solani]
MWLSRGLLASTLLTAIKAQDDNNNDIPSLDIPDLATQIRGSIFAVSLIPHAETTLSGGHGTLNDNDDAFPATAFPHDQSAPGGASPNTAVVQQPPTITIPPSTDYPYERIIKAYTGTRTIINVVTTIAEPDGTRAGTVIVELASTLYSAFTPGQSGALTIPPSLEDPMFTVIQAFPGPTTLPPRTITISASGTNPGTVIIQTPWPETPNTATPGSPGAPDAGSPDAGSPGSGSPDSGAPGAGSPDSGSPDAGSPDSGSPGADAPGAGSPGSPGSADTSNVVIIQTYTGTVSITRPVITTITAPGGGQGTVVIQVPPGTQGAGETVTIPPSADSPFTTILRPHTGPTPISTAVTILIPPTAGGDGGTIVIETPTPDSGDTGIIDPGNKFAQPGNELPTGQRNVVVTLPSDPNSPFVTIVQGHDGTNTITVPTTITIQPSGGEKGTIIIETPNAPAPTQGSPITIAPGPGGSTTTIVREHTGDPITVPTTITITGAPGQPGTIIIETPSPNSPQTRVRSPDEPITIPSGPDSPTTIFRPHVGDPITEPITLTIAPSGGQPGTVVIETPAPSTPQPGQETITIPAGGDSPWATIVRPHPGDPITSAITITQTPDGDQPGTIIIETPVTKVQQTPTAQTPSGAQTSPGVQTGPDGSVHTSQPGDSGNGELTIPPSRDNPYITIYQPHTGDPITAPITITQTPANGQPGTIIIETPATRFNTPAGTEPITIPTASDRPYVTIYRPHEGSPITEPITITQPPANGQPGTIIIETPAPEVTVAPTSSAVFTIYIETPPPVKWAQTQSSAQQPTTVSGSDGYITIYTPYPGPGTIDTPITIVTPPRDGQPGTVLIETPVPQTPTQGPVETPEPATTVSGSDGYVTIYTPYPGPGKISSPITIITPPQGGQPGTVLIETPVPDPTQPQQSGPATVTDPERWVTIYTPFPGPGTISQPITITQPPANGQPGTVLIETPVPQSSSPSDFYVTVYRPYPGPGTITTPITLTQPPANGQPGTIFIETPAPPTQTPTPTVPQTSAGPITIPPGPSGSYVTIYRPYPGPGTITAPITYTQQPSNGQPGTVIIETPVLAAPSTTETPGGTLTVPTASDRPYVTIYRPYPGPGNIDHPITMTQPPANGQPGTIIIETPTPVVFTKFQPTSRPPVTIPADDDNYITIYRPHTGAPITAPITVTTIAPSGGQPGTVIIETPAVVEPTEAQTTSNAAVTIPQGQDGYVTVYRPHTGSPITAPITVTTILPSGGQPGTVIIETPAPVDPTQPETTTAPPPVTIPADQGGYVTIYRPYPGPGSITAPLTVGTIAPSGGQPGTVIIETPVPQTPTETQSPPVTVPQGDDGYVTVYRPYPGPGVITAPLTVTTIAPSGGQPGTVIIETPVSQTPAPTESATLTVSDQNGYITIYRPYTGASAITAPITVTTIPPSGGQPGTVIIETLVPQTPTETQSSGNPPVTIPPGPDNSYVTVYQPYPGPGVITAPVTVTTIEPSGGQPGTIIIQTPVPLTPTPTADPPVTIPPGPENSYVTVYRPHEGPDQITAPITVTTIEPTNGLPGTIIIETPGLQTGNKVNIPPVTLSPGPQETYVTVYRPHTGADVITAPVTVTTIAPTNGQPGTVIIETPEPQSPEPNPTVTIPPGPEESYVTVFRPHTGADVITAPITITTIAPSGGQPGTVIIETPVQPDPTTSTPEAAPTTISSPGASYITVYRPHTGVDVITAPVTVTTIPPFGDQPGTVIIETPVEAQPTSTQEAPSTVSSPGASYITVYRPHTGPDVITAPVTVTTILPSGDQPGTVIIETPGPVESSTSADEPTTVSSPGATYITVYRPHTGPDVITAPITVTTIPPSGDQPGTVIIETPTDPEPTPAPAPPLTTSRPGASYLTVYRPHTGADEITGEVTITTIDPTDDGPGTIIIETPIQRVAVPTTSSQADYYVTVYRPHEGPDVITEPVTVTTIAPSDGQPGTVIIETPGQAPPVTTRPEPSWITIFRAYTGTPMITESTTVTTIDPQGDEPGTIIIETPAPVTSSPAPSWITIFRPYTGTPMISEPTTVTTIDPQGDQPGTVIIETPGQAPPITATPEPSWITIYRPYTGTPPITEPTTVTTIDPQGDQPGTVIVETPGQAPPVTASPEPSYVTVYRAYTGVDPITGPVTVTTIPPDGDQPGTVVIETPVPVATSAAPSYITVFRPYTGTPMITSPVTVTTIEPQGDQPGTVIIETPGQAPPITATPEPSYVTVYRPYPGPGEITAPVTVTTIEPQGDEPGTVIIETPGQAPPVTAAPAAETTEAPTTTPPPTYITVFRPYPGPGIITVPFTVTTIEPQGDQPGTVIIETPGEAPPVTATPEPSYITVFRPYPGPGEITAPVTVTTIEPQGDQPGTVIIETPGQAAPVTAAPASYVTVYTLYTGAEPITGPITVTTIPPQGDEPGTVVIETPGPEPTTSREPSYITVYRPHSGPDVITAPVTVTTIEPQGDQPGTVIIETPGQASPVTTAEPSYITIWRAYTGVDPITNSITVTTIPPQGDQPGTVIIETPVPQPTTSAEPSYITVYRPYPGPGQITAPVTVTTIEPQGDQPGTVIIETPGQAPPITTSEPAPEPSYVTVYRPYPGPGEITAPVTVTTIEPQGDQPGTVIIETPGQAPPITTSEPAPEPSYVTVYRPYPGPGEITAPVTVTTIEPSGTEPGTVIIETPGQAPPITTSEAQPTYITIYTPYPGPGQITAPITVTTIEPQGTEAGTVIIETPGEAPPITTSEPAPEPSYVTVYRPYPGPGQITAPVTVTTIEPQGTEPGTVIIETPGQAPPITTAEPSYITITRPYSGVNPITGPITVTTIPPTGTDPGTVIIETPEAQTTTEFDPSYITITRAYRGIDPITGPITVTTIPPAGTDPGTVIIETPEAQSTTEFDPSYITITQPYRGLDPITGPITVTTIPPTGTDPGTVIIETPEAQTTSEFEPSYITIYRPYSGVEIITAPTTVTTIPPQGTDPGTVIIETPGQAPPITTSDPEPSYITITRPYTGAEPITAPITVTTIPPTGTDPGTVIIETPSTETPTANAPVTVPAGDDSYVTVFRAHTGPDRITAPVTVTTIAPANGQPGTVIIETPDATTEAAPTTAAPEPTYVTIYRPYTGSDTITAPVTVTTIAPTNGDPGTVIIETQVPQTQSDSYVTVYRPYTGTASYSEPITVTTIAPTNGEPGTVIIETLAPQTESPETTTEPPAITIPPSDNSRNVTVIRQYPGPGTIDSPITSYEPPSGPGEPGTVIIETPAPAPATTSEDPGRNVTVYTAGPSTLTEPYTTYSPPGSPGDPGTVIIETPAERNVTVIEEGPEELTEPHTTYSPPRSAGDPGTIIIDTPRARLAVRPTTTTPEPETTSTEAATINTPTAPTASTTEPITEPASTDDGTTSNPDALTITPDDKHDHITVVEPNTEYPGVTDNITHIIPPTDGQPGTHVIYTPVTDTAESTSESTSDYVTRFETITIPGDPSTLTKNDTTSGDPETTGVETNTIIIPPSGTEPGTVLVHTSVYLDQTLAQHGNVTITRAGPPGVTTPFTTYEPPAQETDPGTIIIETPDYNVTITRAAPESITTTFTTYSPPANPGDPGTVIVETPDYNVTITREAPASITTPFTTYNPPGTPGDPGTVIVETPNGDYNITITRAAPQSVTTLFTTYSPPASKGDPGTIIVETPDYNVTITREAPASITTPFTTYNPPGTPGDPGTVVVETPNGDYNVTITRAAPASITTPFTTYSPPATPGDPGTVIVETPDYNVTITRAAPPSVTTPFTTYSPPGTPGDPGTVIVETPDYNVTITRAGPSSVTTRFTTYSPPGSAGDPGTIIIETPDYNVTVTRSGPTSWTTYSPPASADDPGTIFIDVPEDRVADPTKSDEPTTAEESRNVTITRARPSAATDMFTTYEPPATRGDPGTIIIETPLVRVAGNDPTTVDETTTTEETTTLEEPSASNVTITEVVSTITRPYTTYSPAGARGDPGTVIIELPPDHNVTVTEYVSSRTAPYTTYSRAAVQGDPNTVVIELPPERNVTTTEYISTITAPYTTYSPPGAAGDPGTVIIELPPERNVTTTEYVSTITAPYTTYSPPGAAGDPGTIIIELPPDRNVTTTEYVSTITAPYTTYSPPGAAGDPGTIIIELPPDRNVTTTEYVSTITAAYTTYSPPASPGDPGTIIIELPPDRNVTITELPPDHNVTITAEVETITEPYTTYSPPANRGDPGTIIIELPPDRNVTITKEVDTITEPYTTYSAPANRGDPGTVIVELPPDRNVTVTTVIETITQAYTTYASPANRGDPGTVIVELPPDHNVTITTQVDTITAPYTTYSPPANRGDPGTIIVELPPDHNVTITTEVDTITAPYTAYSPPANRGDPGTIIVEMPPDRNVTITTVVDTITAPYTTYSPPANRGDPGTVIVELPPDHNVTITTEVETITEPYTTYSPPANRGDPGTIIVEMPPERNVTTTVAGPSTLTGRYTTYSPPGRAGDPGTIIVETPPHHNITITTEGDETLTGPFTTYIPPGSEDDPGTILIETPRARVAVTTTSTSTTSHHDAASSSSSLSPSTTSRAPTTTSSTTTSSTTSTTTSRAPTTSSSTTSSTTSTTSRAPTTSSSTTTSHSTSTSTSSSSSSTSSTSSRSTTSTTTSRSTTTTTTTTSSAAAATVRFDCDVYGYLFQKTSLYRVEITTGKTTLIKSGIGPGGWINGIGYNRYDDYIYGMVMDDTGSQLIRIGADGGWTLLSARVSNRNVIMGDIDNQGRYWFSDAGRPWWAIDLYPGSSTYGKIILSGTATHDDGMADWAFVPGGGDYMYAIQYTSTSSTLTRFSRTSYTWQTLKAFGNITGNNVWGALYAAADGNLYGSENTSGNIYKFPIAPTIGTPKFLAAGPVSSWNDGARCIDSESIVA